MNKKLELAKDIVAFASILEKFGGDSLLESQTLFIEALNEAGFRTPTGKEFTKMGFRKMFERMTDSEKAEIIETMKEGRRGQDLFEMMSNR